ncbi:MAG TPA: TrbI/VirB10 family protein, partial [Chthoniobacterales bacterium]
LPALTPLPVATQAPPAPPVPPEAAPVTASPAPDERQKQRLAAYEAAIRAKAGVDNGEFQVAVQQRQQLEAQKVAALQRVDPNSAQDAFQEYQRQLAQAQAMVGSQNGANGAGRNPNDLAAFNGSKDRFTLPSRLERPATPYVLQTGSVIPAVVLTGMDSDLPGAITAQVSQNVYDTPSGQYLLIPQGTRLCGEYASQVAYGQSRIFVAWERLIYPNGSTLDLGAMPGADEQGMAGFHDRVDAHLVRTFGSAVLMSAITAGFTWGQGRNTGGSAYGNNGVSASDALGQALGQNLGTAASQLLEKNLNVAPTLKIRPAYRFNVTVVRDLTFNAEYRVPNY